MASFRESLPPYLHRYAGIRGKRALWFEDLVLRSQLYFPSYTQLNDPFEGSIPYTFEAEEREVRAYWEDVAAEEGLTGAAVRARVDQLVRETADPATRAEHIRRTADAVSKHGVVCFSEGDKDLLLWSYYADGHQGVCFRFHAAALFSRLCWEGCTPPVPVRYAVDYPTLNFYRSSYFERVRALIATKADVWEPEHEWRIVRHIGSGPVEFDPDALDAVILGCRVSSDDRARVVDIISRRNPKVRILQAHRDEHRYRLVVTE